MGSPGYEGVLRALAHPLRAQILGALEGRRASPRELADELGAPLGNVSYHVRVLRDLKLIRLVKKTARRGAVEHHYEAMAAAQIGGEVWAEVPPVAKQALLGAALSEIGQGVLAAASGGGFDRPGALPSRTRLVLDERGWVELAAELARTIERAEQIASQSRKRLARSGHDGELRAALVAMLFEERAEGAASAGET